MSRYGVQPEDLPALMQSLRELNVEVNSIYTHFSSAIDQFGLNKKQMDLYMSTTKSYA